jgi:hypothetical protein
VWSTSRAGVTRYVVHKQVANLPAGGDARAIVSFRWIGAGGAIVKHTHLRTPLCHQPDLRADLVVGGLTAQPAADPAKATYVVTVRNDGDGDAAAFEAALSIGASAQPAQSLSGLAAGDASTVTFTGPRCAAGEALTVRLDPGDRIDESDETDDVRTFPCPLAP